MRRPTALLALAVSVLLLVACGKSDRPASHPHASSRPSEAAGTGGTGSAGGSEPLTKQRALAFAGAINLTAADLPGFAVSHGGNAKTPRELKAEREMLRCTGSRNPGGGLASAGSKDFVLKHGLLDLGVSSEVGVSQRASEADAELAAIRSARIKGCFSRYLDEVFRGEQFGGGVAGPVSIQAGTPPAPGSDGSFGWRVTAPLTVHGIKVSFYMDILGFVYGPARVTLFSSGALVPFPATVQQRLFTRLLERAKAFQL